MREVRQVSEFGWYRPCKSVAMEVQTGEVGEVSEFGWYFPSETVVGDAQPQEVRQVAEFGRQCAVQRAARGHSKDEYRLDALRSST